MKQIINGKKYDTETATLIAEDSYLYQSDFRYYDEALYKTKKGAWFLAGEGGPMSKYAEPTGDGNIGYGNGIKPLLKSEAQTWLEEINEIDALEEHFSDSIEAA